MHDLAAIRDQLRVDVEVLERHLDEQRARAQQAVDELQRMLDDPSSLGEVGVPVVSDVVVPLDEVEPASQRYSEEEAPAQWIPDDDVWADADVEAAEDGEEAYDPPTQPIDMLAERDADDDAYLAELRKAMTDETPLGPRDDAVDAGAFQTATEAGRSRFGRRR